MLPVLRMGAQGPLYQESSKNMQQLQGTITLATNFIHIYALNYIILSSNILCISLYIIACKMKNLNKSNVFDFYWVYWKNLEKKNDEKII